MDSFLLNLRDEQRLTELPKRILISDSRERAPCVVEFAMEKFLFTLKLSKGSKLIGWLKLVLSAVIALFLLAGLIFSSGLKESLKKILSADEKESQFEFYAYLWLVTLFSIAYAAMSFVLIIGIINRHHIKVLSFVIIDGVLCLLLLLAAYHMWLSVLVTIAALVQLYLFYSVFCFWRQLYKEHKVRLENQEARSKNQVVIRSKPAERQEVSVEISTNNQL